MRAEDQLSTIRDPERNLVVGFAVLVRFFEGSGGLSRDLQRLLDGNRASGNRASR